MRNSALPIVLLNFVLVGQLIWKDPSICHAGGTEAIYRDSAVLMGTVVELAVAHESEAIARDAIAEALAELRKVDEDLSGMRRGSAVALLNREGSRRQVVVEKGIFDLMRYAAAIGDASAGAFDITVWPVVELWGFMEGGRIPPASDLAIALRKVGYKKILFNNTDHSVGFSIEGMMIDLGAIAEGWAADRVAELLKSRGVRNAIIDVGGDLRLLGGRPGREFWRIGVKHPREAGALLATFELRDIAVSTSGDYERFFVEDGVRYHHILDPATGQPARGCRSVTVLAPTAAEADACSTAAFVLGPERGLDFLRARPGVRGLIVDAAGGLHWTDQALERSARR